MNPISFCYLWFCAEHQK